MALQYESHNQESPFGLYGPLNEKLNFYRSKLDTWVEHQKELADKVAAEQKEAIAKKQAEVDHHVTSLLALNIDENLYVDGKENVHDVQGRVENEQQRVETLQKQLDGKKQELEELRKEYNEFKERAVEVRRQKQETEMSKETTIDDLTRGIINYKYLGLDFERVPDDKLRFCFTQLDPSNPSRKFWFEMDVTELDCSIPNCEPPIRSETREQLVQAFNKNEDMQEFVLGMRRAFLEVLADQVHTPPTTKQNLSILS
ncbi:kinetochore protein Spc25, fungi type [Fistulifera solaris]|uniref:Kinetochore protein SPC25 n=1 Tax=Fistulifera solaris TaxID=1519565 RepID=A0A1Z5JTJ8_FISSO|nr:kinetochore protein Spc25, fungi type [Fistulifera solaris]|eukprot:GAX17091.1 kinetochore protein Spc25, fungi type [Fistulifera solaris]